MTLWELVNSCSTLARVSLCRLICCRTWLSSCTLTKIPAEFGLEPPERVPKGSYTSPSMVTDFMRTFLSNVTRLAASASLQISVLPNTHSIAVCTSLSYPTRDNAKSTLPGASRCAVAIRSADALNAWILLRGINVQRRRSWPLSSNWDPMISFSTTTLYSRPPAQISSAVELSNLSLSRLMSSAIKPLTLERSKVGVGLVYTKSRFDSLRERFSSFCYDERQRGREYGLVCRGWQRTWALKVIVPTVTSASSEIAFCDSERCSNNRVSQSGSHFRDWSCRWKNNISCKLHS